MNPRVLMIAFHYPPYQGSSGVLRTLNFTKYLPQFGWAPQLLTANIGVYGLSGTQAKGGLVAPEGVEVSRALAFDTARDLSIKGRYPSWLALPDRWGSWSLFAIFKAWSLVRKHRPAVLWSTYPIATAHLIGLAVHRMTGLAWIADFRDSMTEDEYPHDPRQRKVYRWIEAKTVRAAHTVIFTTPSTAKMYAERYPDVPPGRWRVIPNGYDEETFRRVEQSLGSGPAGNSPADAVSGERPLTLLHSGVLYPVERDPKPFLAAVAELKRTGRVSPGKVRFVFRATSHDSVIQPLIQQYGVEDLVHLQPPIPYESALAEVMSVDALLLFQAANCNHQIPAKLYEYLRSGRPIFALTDVRGDTARTLLKGGIDAIADLSNAAEIQAKLDAFLILLHQRRAPAADRQFALGFSRQSQAEELARILHAAARAAH